MISQMSLYRILGINSRELRMASTNIMMDIKLHVFKHGSLIFFSLIPWIIQSGLELQDDIFFCKEGK